MLSALHEIVSLLRCSLAPCLLGVLQKATVTGGNEVSGLTVIRKTAIFGLTALLGGLLAPAAAPVAQDKVGFRVPGLVIVWAADGAGASAPIVSNFIIDTGTGNTAATSGDTDLIGQDVFTVVTGTLAATDDGLGGSNGTPFRLQNIPGGGFLTDSDDDRLTTSDDSFSSFRIRQNSDINTRRAEISSSFYVASNTAFSIDAQSFPIGTTTPEQMSRMRLWLTVTTSGNDGLAFGSAAQHPSLEAGRLGSRANGRRLSTFETPRRVFRGDRATAAGPGTIADQSVRFDLRYRYNDGDYDLSEGAYDAEATVVYTVYIP